MRIICDLLSTTIPLIPYLSEDFRRPDYPPLPRFLDPVVYAKPAETNREEGNDNV